MKIILNEKLVKRNAKIGQITSLLSLLTLGSGMYISFKYPEKFSVTLTALLVGFLLSQVSLYYGNRWGRIPRPDQLLDQNLKGLPGNYRIYHYASPVPHLLIGPAGVWVLLPYHQKGKVSYDGKRWHLKGGGFGQAYMRIFGQDNLGRPELDAGAEVSKLHRFFEKTAPDAPIPPIRAALVFTSPNVELDVENAPIPALHLKKLKPFFRKEAKSSPLSEKDIERLSALLPAP